MIDPISVNSSANQSYGQKVYSESANTGMKSSDLRVESVEKILPEDHQVKVDDKKIIDAIEKANKHLEVKGTSLRFSIHELTKQIMVKIVSNETEEVIKEVPPEKILDMVASMMVRAGIIVDKKG